MLPVEEFYIENDYAPRHPESLNSVIIATNGVGDYIGLLPEKDNKTQLGETIYEFLHETGKVRPYKKG